MSRAASLHRSDDGATAVLRRAARLLPLLFALLFAPAASPRRKEKTPATQPPPLQSVKEQQKQTGGETPKQSPTCPHITLRCPPKIDAGRPAAFTAFLKRTGPAARREAYRWTVSAGNERIINGQSAVDVHHIAVSTDGLGGNSFSTTFAVGGYGPGCESSCQTFVAPHTKPTPLQQRTPAQKESPTIPPTPVTTKTATPTPLLPTNNNTGPAGTFTPTTPPTPATTTPTQTPGAAPSPAESATPLVAVISSPPASPPSIVNEETTDAGLLRRYWPLLPLLALLASAAALLFAKRAALADVLSQLKGSATDPSGTPEPPPPDDPVKQNEMEEAIVGGTTRKTDELHCTVYAPHECLPGDGLLVQAFAHLKEHAAQLEALAKEADREATRRGEFRAVEVERGQELLFHLDMPGLVVDDPAQSIVWNGEIEAVQYGVSIPEEFGPRRINCKLTVSVKEFPIGHVRFVFEVGAAPRPAEEKQEEAGLVPAGEFVRYRKGFVSYASKDLPEVLARVQVMRLLGIEFFHDLLSLKPGERWERALYKHIDDCDVFFLFWSAAAHKSEWVEKEVRYALARKGADDGRPPEILPVILEGPPEVPPPSYLPERHFNDPIALLIKVAAARRQPNKDT